MPHFIGPINRKHVRIKCPKNIGSLYHNYKESFSLVLLAICDANYCFTLFDVSQYNSNSDSGILIHSNMGDYLEITQPESVEKCNFDLLRYLLVVDKIFRLRTWFMRPYPGKLADQERVLNYLHCSI